MTDAIGGARERAALIGRRVELSWLRTRYDQARRGVGQLVVVTGEMGIGKTRLATELLHEARRDGAVVVRGRSYEHLRDAFLPLRESLFPVLSTWAAERPAFEADRAQLAPLLQGSLDDAPSPTGGVADRGRQLLALTRLTIEYVHERPGVLFLDDLQWADDATSDFLRHLLFRFEDEPVPLLLLATARTDPTSDPDGVARLMGEPRAAGLTVHPLPPLEATELARELAGEAPVEHARNLAGLSGGNPLLIDVLTRTGAGAGSGSGTSTLPMTAALDGRLAGLGTAAHELVQLAAFLVPECRAETLVAVSGLDAARADAAIDEAIVAGVLTEDGDELGFAHPLYAHLAYDRTPTRTRRTIHARIAETLLADRPGDVRTIAHHLVSAGPRADRALTARYARQAADLAFGVTAWNEAARYYEAAIESSAPDVGAVDRAALHRLAGLSRRGNLELAEAVAHFDQALALLGEDADPTVRTDLHTWRIRCGIGSHTLLDDVRDASPLEALADAVQDADPALAAEAFVELSQSAWIAGDMRGSERAGARALDLATRARNWEAYSRAAMSLAVPQWLRYDLQGSLTSLRDGVAHESFAGEEAELAGGPRFRIPLVLVWSGHLDEAREAAEECCALAERVNYPLEVGLPLAAVALVDVVRGRFDDAEQAAHRALLVQRLSGYHWAAGLFVPAHFAACLARGRYDDARDALAVWSATAGDQEQWTIDLLGRYADASERDLPVRGDEIPLPRTPAVGGDTWTAVAVELARLEGIAIDARRAYDFFVECEQRGGQVVSGLGMLLARMRGVAADMMGDEDAALAAFSDALDAAHRLGAEPEHARTLTDLAVVRLRRGERDVAAGLLDDATQRFARLGMPVAARRAAALDGGEHRAARIAGASTQATPEAVPTNAVLLFTDVVESTRLTEELGNVRYRLRAREMERLVTSTIVAHRGTIATGISLGDGFIGLFHSVRDALAAARACARDAFAAAELHLHLGVHAGDILVDGTRIYGGPVNYAARICNLAGEDEILVSEVIRDHAEELDVAFVDRGEHVLKGIAGPQRVYAVVDPGR